MRLLPVLLAAALLAGCQSYEISQRCDFADDSGRVMTVGYGRSDSDHTSTFTAPNTGRTMDYRTRLVVEVDLPDGESFRAWQCMNFNGSGTTYRTDDEEWLFLANGFTSAVYRREGRRYRQVFSGVICKRPGETVKRDERWKKERPVQKTYKKK